MLTRLTQALIRLPCSVRVFFRSITSKLMEKLNFTPSKSEFSTTENKIKISTASFCLTTGCTSRIQFARNFAGLKVSISPRIEHRFNTFNFDCRRYVQRKSTNTITDRINRSISCVKHCIGFDCIVRRLTMRFKHEQ